jgi:hypothetical protein
MRRASVQSNAPFATRVWDLPVRRPFVPIVVIALARVVVCQRLQPGNQHAFPGRITLVIELADPTSEPRPSTSTAAHSPLKVVLHANTVLHDVLAQLLLVPDVAVTVSDPAVVKSLPEKSVRTAV